MPGLALHSRHLRMCVKAVSSTPTMMLAALKQPSQQITCVSLPCDQGQRLRLCSPVSFLTIAPFLIRRLSGIREWLLRLPKWTLALQICS